MNLYKVSANTPSQYRDVYEVYIIAASEKHAEKRAQLVYRNSLKMPLIVKEADVTHGMIDSFREWYR